MEIPILVLAIHFVTKREKSTKLFDELILFSLVDTNVVKPKALKFFIFM